MTDEEIDEATLLQRFNGRRTVLIRIGYAGKGQPGKQLRERCDTLVDMIVEADAGLIAGRKDGVGEVERTWLCGRGPSTSTFGGNACSRSE